MSYIALYRKWRPLTFLDVVGQKNIVRTLKNSIVSGRIAHAYLFCGSHGTGKTTTAKLLARAVNCLDPKDGDPCNKCEICSGILDGSLLDVVEIDAASNNSVDNVRDIRDEVSYLPSRAKYKVYIIDEVHMLSTGAFNALLKTLEEPPSHIIFILATTEQQKLPATILSRCQKYEFKRISNEDIIERLKEISADSEVSFEEKALRLIARSSDGAMRDAISLLDQCMSTATHNKITYEHVLTVIGVATDESMYEVIQAVLDENIGVVLQKVDDIVMSGKDVARFCSELTGYLRNILLIKVIGSDSGIVDDVDGRLTQLSTRLDEACILSMIKELSQAEASLRWSTQQRVLLEVTLMKISKPQNFAVRVQEYTREEKGDSTHAGRTAPIEQEGKQAILDKSNHQKQSTDDSHNEDDRGKSHEKVKSNEKVQLKANNQVQPNEHKTYAPFDRWNDLIQNLKKSGRMTLYGNLVGTKAVCVDNKILGIVFAEGSGFRKLLVSKAENLQCIEQAVSDMLKHEMKVKCMDEDEVKIALAVDLQQASDSYTDKTSMSSAQAGSGSIADDDGDEILRRIDMLEGREGIEINVLDE